MARARTKSPDLSLLIVVLILSVLGVLMILSASAPTAQIELKDSLYFFRKQLMWGVMGAMALVVGTWIPLDRLRSFAKPLLFGTALLLVLTHVPGIGTTSLGASRWLRVGPIGLQPSELAKVTLILFLADVLARKPEKGWTIRDLRQVFLPTGAILGLVLFQPDLGTTLMLLVGAFSLFWFNGTNFFFMFATGLTGAAGILIHSLNTPYQRDRWLAFLNPWRYPKDIGFQLIQSLLAIGSGGIFGTGWGQGKQKLFYLPIQYADFIFAVLAEELGLLGTLTVVFLFLFFAQRGFSIARRALQPFQQLLVGGFTTVIVTQALVNIGVVTASLPTTGVPLPFLSFGGTSLLVTLFSVGVILNVSQDTRFNIQLIRGKKA
ncbi:MAG TPA: putative lipid II flippase FtsW [Chroococcales cyanobacterium]|jgi:cell division protein FtsW